MAIQLGFEPGDFTMKTWRAVAAELIATGMFVFIGVGSVIAASFAGAADAAFIVSVAIAHGLGILLAVTVAGKISGGHINPAVTFAMAATGKMKVSTALLYVGAQLVGAILAVLLLKAIIAGPAEVNLGAHALSVYDPEIGGGLLDDSVGNGAGAGLLVEIALTFFLVFVVFAVAVDTKGFTYLAPVAIGLVIMADHLVAIPMTGASMNPARSFGPALVAGEWADHWVYWVGPLIGAAIAALVYEYVFLNREE
ncbi:MAG: MIP/aquaporin family protein [Dehalococcoidia bacterium]